MSKPVTHEEVEDVLSSIRRLVSEDKRPLAGMRNAPTERSVPEPPEDAASADRLVLTPALRVADADEPQEPPLDLGSVAKQTWTDADEARDEPDDGGPMLLFPTQKEHATDGAEMDALDTLVHDALKSENDAVAEPSVEDDYSDESYWDDEDHDLSKSKTDHFEWWNGSPSPKNVDQKDEIVSDNTALDDTPGSSDEGEGHQEDPALTGKEALKGPQRTSTVGLTAKLAALEAAVGDIAQDWEPDGDEEDAMAQASVAGMAWEDDVELDAKGEPLADDLDQDNAATDGDEAVKLEEAAPQAEEPQVASPQVAAAFGGDDQLMDEEALRDLVSEIVRAELQGALGERITRNVRKLVRREIHRALTAQEME